MKTTNLLLFVCTAILLLSVGSISKAQSLTWVPLDTLPVVNSNEVIIYYAESCMDSTAVLLKMENGCNQPVSVNWSLWPGLPVNTTVLNPVETREAQCTATELLKEFIPAGHSILTMNPTFTVQ